MPAGRQRTLPSISLHRGRPAPRPKAPPARPAPRKARQGQAGRPGGAARPPPRSSRPPATLPPRARAPLRRRRPAALEVAAPRGLAVQHGRPVALVGRLLVDLLYRLGALRLAPRAPPAQRSAARAAAADGRVSAGPAPGRLLRPRPSPCLTARRCAEALAGRAVQLGARRGGAQKEECRREGGGKDSGGRSALRSLGARPSGWMAAQSQSSCARPGARPRAGPRGASKGQRQGRAPERLSQRD